MQTLRDMILALFVVLAFQFMPVFNDGSAKCIFDKCDCLDQSRVVCDTEADEFPKRNDNYPFKNFEEVEISGKIKAQGFSDSYFAQLSIGKLRIKNNLDKISKNTFKDVSAISQLEIVNSKLAEIETDALKPIADSLLSLNLHSCKNLGIEQINPLLEKLATLNELTHLKIVDSPLNTIKLEAFNSLKLLSDLSLQHNEIVQPFSDVFAHDSLKKLTLDNNKMGKLTEKAIFNLPQLAELSLRSNDLESVESYAFDRAAAAAPSLKLNLADNSKISFGDKAFCRRSPSKDSPLVVQELIISIGELKKLNACMARQLADGKITLIAGLNAAIKGNEDLVCAWREHAKAHRISLNDNVSGDLTCDKPYEAPACNDSLQCESATKPPVDVNETSTTGSSSTKPPNDSGCLSPVNLSHLALSLFALSTSALLWFRE